MLRTRTRLQQALFELAHERGMESVSVSDVAERAGINRSTFYQHYADLDTVLADALDWAAAQEGARLETLELSSNEPPEPLIAFIRHIEEHAAVYRQVIVGGGAGAVAVRLRARIRDMILVHLERRSDCEPGSQPGLPVDVLAAGISGSIAGVIGAWLELDPRPGPEEAAAWVWAIVLGPPPGSRLPA